MLDTCASAGSHSFASLSALASPYSLRSTGLYVSQQERWNGALTPSNFQLGRSPAVLVSPPHTCYVNPAQNRLALLPFRTAVRAMMLGTASFATAMWQRSASSASQLRPRQSRARPFFLCQGAQSPRCAQGTRPPANGGRWGRSACPTSRTALPGLPSGQGSLACWSVPFAACRAQCAPRFPALRRSQWERGFPCPALPIAARAKAAQEKQDLKKKRGGATPTHLDNQN